MITITEALAEMKTINKRIDNKANFVTANLWRPSIITDALAADGGAEKRVGEEMQAIGDLFLRLERIRVRIQEANQKNLLTVQGQSKSVAAWLAWRKECAPKLKTLFGNLTRHMAEGNKQARTPAAGQQPWNVVEHYSTSKIQAATEFVDNVLGELDGKLSLFNATCTINVD